MWRYARGSHAHNHQAKLTWAVLLCRVQTTDCSSPGSERGPARIQGREDLQEDFREDPQEDPQERPRELPSSRPRSLDKSTKCVSDGEVDFVLIFMPILCSGIHTSVSLNTSIVTRFGISFHTILWHLTIIVFIEIYCLYIGITSQPHTHTYYNYKILCNRIYRQNAPGAAKNDVYKRRSG